MSTFKNQGLTWHDAGVTPLPDSGEFWVVFERSCGVFSIDMVGVPIEKTLEYMRHGKPRSWAWREYPDACVPIPNGWQVFGDPSVARVVVQQPDRLPIS